MSGATSSNRRDPNLWPRWASLWRSACWSGGSAHRLAAEPVRDGKRNQSRRGSAMFDALVRELGSRFDLGGKAESLVRSLLAYMFQDESRGLTSFLDRFKKAGLGDLVNSWIGNASPRELTPGQLEGALGGSFISQIADKTGLSIPKVTAVLPLLLPKLIGMLTADGKIPTTMPAAVSSWLGGSTKTVEPYRAEPAGATLGSYREPTTPAADSYRERETVGGGRAMRMWILPLLGLIALGLLLTIWTSRRAVQQATNTTVPMASPPTAATSELWPVKIYFPTGSTTLAADDSARVQRAADYLKANPGAVVDITGFSDKTGGAAANEELAKERAQAVRTALVSLGVPEAQAKLAPPVNVTGGGNDAEARRVEIRPKL